MDYNARIDALIEKHENIVITTDPAVCPRCGCKNTNWGGGDMDAHGGYFHMYLCEDCNRGDNKGILVFLVSCSEE